MQFEGKKEKHFPDLYTVKIILKNIANQIVFIHTLYSESIYNDHIKQSCT